MSLTTILLISLGLAMDAFAVSITCGLAFARREHAYALRIALFFGLFQAGMPLLGWVGGLALRSVIQAWDHWVAFGLLAAIGIHMIVEAVRGHPESLRRSPPGIVALFGLSVATSLDALAVGLSLSFLRVRIVTPAAIIGIVTFLISFSGIVLGHESKALLHGRGQRAVQILGGAILLGIGIKILWQQP